jgi:hypothetical protein
VGAALITPECSCVVQEDLRINDIMFPLCVRTLTLTVMGETVALALGLPLRIVPVVRVTDDSETQFQLFEPNL